MNAFIYIHYTYTYVYVCIKYHIVTHVYNYDLSINKTEI